MTKEKYDVIIIGGGPAGLTAGLYAVRSGLKTAIIAKEIGGTANSILSLENWPGFKGNGSKLMKSFYDQILEYNQIKFYFEEVKRIEKKKDFVIKTEKIEIEAKALILATGTERRKLAIPGEKELIGKGVSYCVTCDAFFFKNKTTAVIGGSDCAATSALALSDLAKKVYIVYRGQKLRCEDATYKKIENKKNIETIYNALPKEILGKGKVTGVIFEDKETGKKREITVDGIFVEIGATPLTGVIKNLDIKLDKENYISINENMETSVKGIYACGDVTDQKLKQVVVASGQGAIAAKNVYEFLRK
jgi:thioredoxin reductase (NADPH)